MVNEQEYKSQKKAAAATLAKAKPATASAVLSLFKSVFLPMLPGLISELLKKASARTKRILIQVRDVLNEAELDEV